MPELDYSAPFTLYYSPVSLRAIMIQLTFAMRGQPRSGRPDMSWKTHYIQLGPDQPDPPDQLSEDFLLNVNSLGEVPVLANEALLQKPMLGTVDITWYLCDWYPELLPKEHDRVIRDLMDELHQIDFSILMFGPGATLPTQLRDIVVEKLREDGISEDYRKALEYKAIRLSKWQDTLTTKTLEQAVPQTRELCIKVDKLKREFGGEYIFGSQPTALDAHMLSYLRRLDDTQWNELVPQSLQEWAKGFQKGDLWGQVTENRSTMPPP